MTLYIFITHQKNFNNCYQRISDMMVDDFIVVQGGFIKDSYNEETRVLNLNCNDKYFALPEKVIKTFDFLISDERFSKYTHFVKLDDDMVVLDKNIKIEEDYCGVVHRGDGSRTWHMGRCGNFWDKLPYFGEFTPWCMGGYGYIISRKALEKVLPNHDYSTHIYEDVYIGLILKNKEIYPTDIDTQLYFISPDHK